MYVYITKGSSFGGFSDTLRMTSEARGSRTGNTDFSIARILADDPPDADVDVARKRHESPGHDFSRRRTEVGERTSGSRTDGEPDGTSGETRRDVPVVAERRRSGDRDNEDITRRTDLTWLQYTRYRPPRLPRRSFAERRVKRRSGDHPRIPFSSSQLQVLEDRYRRSAYLSRSDVVEMSATLRLPQSKQNVVEPMQVDAPTEDNDNAEEEPYIVENPTLDLEVYANSYTGLAKLNRLVYIADHCPSLRIEALKMAITYVMTTYNVGLYITLHKKLVEAMGYTSGLPDIAAQSTSQDMPTMDQTWVETRAKKAALKLEKFDTDLKNYKSNSIKESIRRGHDDLGDHYLNCGDLVHALKCYSRARDYCTSGKHVVNMCLNVIKVSVYLQNWSHVLSYVTKAESTPDFPELHGKDNNQAIVTKLKVAAGLAELATRKYKMAAKHFLQASLDHCDCPELLSPGNVALYGGLCALATFDRHELQKQVIFSSSFKLFLELEPQLRDIIFKFYESKYASCLKLLDEIKDNILLDMYIAPHVNLLYTQIRNRALIQYFSPYLSADMRRMATAFNRTVSELEDELMQLILDGQIQARIDSHNKILYAKDVDQRSTTFEKSMSVGKDYQRRTRMLILRAAMLKQQIHVKSPQRDSTQGGEMSVAPGNGTLAVKN